MIQTDEDDLGHWGSSCCRIGEYGQRVMRWRNTDLYHAGRGRGMVKSYACAKKRGEYEGRAEWAHRQMDDGNPSGRDFIRDPETRRKEDCKE